MKEGSRNKIRLVYLGPRYPSTYEAWYGRMFPNPYSHIERPSKMKITNRQYAGSKEDTQTCLIFDAEMQSGNLDAAIRVLLMLKQDRRKRI